MKKTLMILALIMGFTQPTYAEFLGLQDGTQAFLKAAARVIRHIDLDVNKRKKPQRFKINDATYTLKVKACDRKLARTIIGDMKALYKEVMAKAVAQLTSKITVNPALTIIDAETKVFADDQACPALKRASERKFRDGCKIRYSSAINVIINKPVIFVDQGGGVFTLTYDNQTITFTLTLVAAAPVA